MFPPFSMFENENSGAMFQAGEFFILDMGCWTDRSPGRAIDPLENTLPDLKDEYKTRKNAVWKCIVAADSLGQCNSKEA